ncbi:peptide/nickel transport system substrate-binding protein [Enterovibrio norvegicus DSM 15893]|uniref:Peptide/nickel transport system substrate-binding protein n=2 Tax=Enterovibrio norvegicus TaxID=188144 RepID=A0A1I5RBQ2_9GAMM|nr:peptide ABC transporter substrate-binding protein [Enterovibrio norvegicus]SFP55952.1 peptide/nickel transport system substrate-binding protein [Enterovibrio norvegicus DSM 15893]
MTHLFTRCAAAAVLLSVASFTSLATEPEKPLKIGISQYPTSLHPLLGSSVAGSYVLSTVWRPMMIYGKDWQPLCHLCQTVPTFENGLAEKIVLDDGREGIRLSVTLKDNLFWGDGVPVTSKDVALGYQISTDKRVKGNPGYEEDQTLERLDIVDEKRLDVILNKRIFNYRTAVPSAMPEHLEGEIYRRDPENYDKTSLYTTSPLTAGLYNGPYLIDRMSSGSFVSVVPNPHWKGRSVFFDNLVFKAVENTAALEAHLLSKSVDMIAGESGLTLDQVLRLEKRQKGKYQYYYEPGLLYEHLDVNLDNPHLAKKAFRQGLLLSINRQQLVNQLFEGKQVVAHTDTSPRDIGYSDDVTQYEYAPEKAKALFQQAGYRWQGKDMVDADGKPVQIELMTTAGNKTRELVQQVLQSQWKKMGITIRINNQPARVFFGQTLKERNHKGLALFAWYSAPESPPETTLHSENIPTEANNWGGQNYAGYKNADMDALLDEIETELDADKREALFANIQRIYAEDLPALPLYFRADSFVLPLWLKGVTPTGHMFPSTHWVEEWHR